MKNAMELKATKEHTDQDNHKTEALVLNCIDHRLVDDVARYLNSIGLQGKYDQISLAGAAIGVLTEKRTAWGETFWEHVKLARELHNIRMIIVIDHRDCGACKAFISKDCAADPEKEFLIHKNWLQEFATEVNNREPDLEVKLALMDLDGSVTEIEPELETS